VEPAELFDVLYDELRRVAGRIGRTSEMAEPSSLVHEAWIRLARGEGREWDELHFRRVAARAMRSVLTDRARRHHADKREGGLQRVTLDGLGLAHSDTIELVDALERLEAADAVASEVVELRFFGGMSVPEAAQALGVAPRTVDRAWRRARAFLAVALGDDPPTPS